MDGALPGGILSTPAYFNNTVYYGSVGGPLKAFPIAAAKLAVYAQFADRLDVYLSGNGTGGVREWNLEWDCVGAREYGHSSAARVRCNEFDQ